MRCARAQKLMVPAVDGELAPRELQMLDQHVTACVACRGELEMTRAVLGRVAALPAEAGVPARLEQATLRAVRLAAAAEEERRSRWWRMPALSTLAVAAGLAAVAAGLRQYSDGPVVPAPAPAAAPAPVQVAKPVEKEAAPVQVPAKQETTVVARPQPIVPAEPPAELAARPELFVDLPILRHMEKLEHLEAIESTALDGGTTPGTDEGERSSG
jgi:anti-sigma factor RsiW